MPIFSWSALVLGSTATEITGTAKVMDSSAIGCFSSQMVSPVDNVLQANRGADIARQNFVDVFALVGVHLQQAANALAASACRR